MSVSTKVGSFALNTTTGNQSITGLTFRPKLVIFFGTKLTADGTGTGSARILGASAKRNDISQIALSNSHSDGADASYVHSYTAECLTYLNNSGTIEYRATMVSMNTDGFTINLTTAPASAYIINYLAIGGSSVTAHVGPILKKATTGNRSYSIGFRPDILFLCGSASLLTDETFSGSGNSTACLGVSVSVTGSGYAGFRSTTTSVHDKRQIFGKGYGEPSSSGGVFAEASLVSFDSAGFTLNFSTTDGSGRFHYIALKTGSSRVGIETQKTSTGTKVTDKLGITPIALLLLSANAITSSTTDDDYRHSVGFATSPTSRGCVFSGKDNGSSSVADVSLNRSAILEMITPGTPTVNAVADLDSIGTESFTLDWTTADATARDIIYLAIGQHSSPLIQNSPINASDSASSLSASFDTLPTSGNLIIVHVGTYNNTTPADPPADAVSDNQGNTYTRAVFKRATANDSSLSHAIYYAYNIGSPSGTFTITYDAANANDGITIRAFEYVCQTGSDDPLDVTATAEGESTTPSSGTTSTTTYSNSIGSAGFSSWNPMKSAGAVLSDNGWSEVNESPTQATPGTTGEVSDIILFNKQTIGCDWDCLFDPLDTGVWASCVAVFTLFKPSASSRFKLRTKSPRSF